MRTSQPQSPPRSSQDLPWRDAALAIGITILGTALAAHFQLSEAIYALTRRWEYFQVDELPLGLLVFSICLIWLSWRRYRHARRELRARQVAEARLAGVLAENRELAQEQLRIQELERKHLARELHDQLGQYLNALKLDAVSILESGGRDPAFTTGASQAIIRTVDHLHGTVSDMIGRLRPIGLDELGLAAAIEHCIDQWRQRLPQTHFSLAVSGNFDDLGEPLTLTLYRLVQEGLTNIYKHARAKNVEIILERRQSTQTGRDELDLSVADDGCGMHSVERSSSHFGLSGMRERVEMVGGTLMLQSAPNQGLRFEARLPARAEVS